MRRVFAEPEGIIVVKFSVKSIKSSWKKIRFYLLALLRLFFAKGRGRNRSISHSFY